MAAPLRLAHGCDVVMSLDSAAASITLLLSFPSVVANGFESN